MKTGFEKQSLDELIDPTVAAIRLNNPAWTLMWGEDGLPMQVAEVIHHGAASARERATEDEDGLSATGGIQVTYNAVGEFTEVWVLMGRVNDPEQADDSTNEA